MNQIEKVARAICSANGCDPDTNHEGSPIWVDWVDDAKAAIAAMQPAPQEPVDAAAEITRLTEALRAAEEREKVLHSDAERYHWLRDHSCPPHNFYISVPDEFAGQRYAPDDVDAYIDAARQALAGAKP